MPRWRFFSTTAACCGWSAQQRLKKGLFSVPMTAVKAVQHRIGSRRRAPSAERQEEHLPPTWMRNLRMAVGAFGELVVRPVLVLGELRLHLVEALAQFLAGCVMLRSAAW